MNLGKPMALVAAVSTAVSASTSKLDPGSCGGKLSDGSPTSWDPATQQPPGPCGIFPSSGTPAGLFWKTVKQGALTVEMRGGAIVPNVTKAGEVPVSVDAALISNRASWIRVPYQ